MESNSSERTGYPQSPGTNGEAGSVLDEDSNKSPNGSDGKLTPANSRRHLTPLEVEILGVIFRLGCITCAQGAALIDTTASRSTVFRTLTKLAASNAGSPALLERFSLPMANSQRWRRIFALSEEGLKVVSIHHDLHLKRAQAMYNTAYRQPLVKHALDRNDYYSLLRGGLAEHTELSVSEFFGESTVTPVKLSQAASDGRAKGESETVYLNPDGLVEVFDTLDPEFATRSDLADEQYLSNLPASDHPTATVRRIYVELDRGTERNEWQIVSKAVRYCRHLLHLKGAVAEAANNPIGDGLDYFGSLAEALPKVFIVCLSPRRMNSVMKNILRVARNSGSDIHRCREDFAVAGLKLPEYLVFTNLQDLRDTPGIEAETHYLLSSKQPATLATALRQKSERDTG